MKSSRPLHIALLTDGIMPYVLGGIQRHSRMLLEHLAKRETRVTLYHTAKSGVLSVRAQALDDLDGPLRGLISSEFVPYPRGPWFPGHYPVDSARYSRALLRAFLPRQRRDPADFIYAQGLTGLAFIRARDAGLSLPPIGVNAHGYEMYQPSFGMKEKLAQLLLRPQHRSITLGADVVFSFSGKIREIVVDRIGADPSRLEVIPNAVDGGWIAKSVGMLNRPRRFLFVGRFERRKGIEELTTALRGLDDASWRMDFVGPIPESARVSDERVRYHGTVTDTNRLIEIYDGCDCMVCPSYAEGMPTVLIEAMARGVMVIATDVGAVSELVGPANGILLKSPQPDLVQAAMRRVMSMSDDELVAMRKACQVKSMEYTWERIASRVIDRIEARTASNARLVFTPS